MTILGPTSGNGPCCVSLTNYNSLYRQHERVALQQNKGNNRGVNRENRLQVEAALSHCNLNGQTYWRDDVSRSLHGHHRLLPVRMVANCCAGYRSLSHESVPYIV